MAYIFLKLFTKSLSSLFIIILFSFMYSWAYPQELFPFSYPPVKFEEPQGEMNSFIPIRQDTTIKV